jgi:predicted TIM-barrel fold metal-dependent hydrolase
MTYRSRTVASSSRWVGGALSEVNSSYSGPVIDASIHHGWAKPRDLTAYMEEGWQHYVLGKPDSPETGRPIPILRGFPFDNPIGAKQPETYPSNGRPPGTDLATTQAQALDGSGTERAVLTYDEALLAPVTVNNYYAKAICGAVNDWCIDQWLSGQDDRLYGLVLAPNQIPDEAAAEIRRVGTHPRMVGTILCGNGAGKAFGHRIYHPLYEACAELGLPVVLHVGGDAAYDATTSTAPAGYPISFSEYSVLSPLPVMVHLMSFIVQGVFEKYPNLRLLVTGAGSAWLPALFWRMDSEWKSHRRETPWLRRSPTDYFREHVVVSTWPLHQSSAENLQRSLDAFGGAEDFLCYASGYPHWNQDSVARAAAYLKPEWHRKVFYDNALSFFRWPSLDADSAAGTTAEPWSSATARIRSTT